MKDLLEKPPILLIDDFPAVHEALEWVLSKNYTLTCRDSALTIIEDYELLGDPIVVLDIVMPGMNGFTAAQVLKRRHPRARIVFLSSNSSRAYVNAAFESGGCAYVSKASAHEDLLPALEAAENGREFISPALQNVAASTFLPSAWGAVEQAE